MDGVRCMARVCLLVESSLSMAPNLVQTSKGCAAASCCQPHCVRSLWGAVLMRRHLVAHLPNRLQTQSLQATLSSVSLWDAHLPVALGSISSIKSFCSAFHAFLSTCTAACEF